MSPIKQLLEFPSVELADEDGLLAIGGDLSVARLQLAYKSGIFPWYSEGEPILWYAPDPRFVLFPDELIISKSMKKILGSSKFSFTMNHAFERVIKSCKEINRVDQEGTWITEAMEQAYIQLHKNGLAISGECWFEGKLVGGLYGVLTGSVFCGESMFSSMSNASKFAFIHLVQELTANGIKLIDCQIETAHLKSLGAKFISRSTYIDFLKE